MPKFTVTLPIAGHAYVDVEAEDSKAAIEAAMETVKLDHIDDWKPLERFNEGNYCYCPTPWEIVVENVDGEEVEEGEG